MEEWKERPILQITSARLSIPTVSDTTCATCGLDRADIQTLTADQCPPCPQCGGTGLTFKRTLSDSATTTESLTTSLQPAQQQRDWLLRWQQLESRVQRVTAPRTEPRSGAAIHSAEQDLFEFY